MSILLGHGRITPLACQEGQSQQSLLVVGVEVERLVEAALGPIEIPGRLMEHAHQEEELGGRR